MLSGRVHIYPDNNRPGFGEFLISQSQADQLTMAIRSPVAPQEEQDDSRPSIRRQRPGLPRLVLECEIGSRRHEASLNALHYEVDGFGRWQCRLA